MSKIIWLKKCFLMMLMFSLFYLSVCFVRVSSGRQWMFVMKTKCLWKITKSLCVKITIPVLHVLVRLRPSSGPRPWRDLTGSRLRLLSPLTHFAHPEQPPGEPAVVTMLASDWPASPNTGLWLVTGQPRPGLRAQPPLVSGCTLHCWPPWQLLSTSKMF